MARTGMAVFWAGVMAAACAGPAPRPSAVTQPRKASPRAEPSAKPVASHAASVTPCPALTVNLPVLITSDIDVAVPELVDHSGHEQMAAFHEKLARLVRGNAKDHVRILMYGDSNLTRDDISGELRRTLQQQWGDGGHGYIGVGKPWNWYIHNDVQHGAAANAWKVYSMSTDQVADHLYGFGGLAAQNIVERARAWVATAEANAPVGRSASRVGVMYLERPGHGAFHVAIDGKEAARIDSHGDRVHAAFRRFDLPDGAHRIELTSEADIVRLLGVVLERDKPGVVVDSVGIGGVNAELLARGDRALTLETLRMRKHDLVLLLTGATEPDSPGHVAAEKELVARHKQALPDAPFVMLSPPDLAGGTVQNPMPSARIEQIEKQKRLAAAESKSMFWDFRGAMGGRLSIVRFAERKMAWNDFIHLTGTGGRYMGRRLAYALMRDFAAYLQRHPRAGCGAEP
ncbi:MAG: hypothetical protein IT375_32460 [Polyangiaceae bacterium]|nr:hypothetical protein [Polyangiaceae bacterium]